MGKRVIGTLPLHLAALAESVTEVPLSVPRQWRGRELSLEEIRYCAGAPRTYVVREVTPLPWEVENESRAES